MKGSTRNGPAAPPMHRLTGLVHPARLGPAEKGRHHPGRSERFGRHAHQPALAPTHSRKPARSGSRASPVPRPRWSTTHEYPPRERSTTLATVDIHGETPHPSPNHDPGKGTRTTPRRARAGTGRHKPPHSDSSATIEQHHAVCDHHRTTCGKRTRMVAGHPHRARRAGTLDAGRVKLDGPDGQGPPFGRT